jgi:hypothetical protein
MTRRGFSLSLAAAAAGALRAETSPGRGAQLVDKTIDALGGDAFLNMRTRTEIGRASSFYHDRLSGFSVARIYTKYLPPAAAKAGAVRLGEVQRQVLGKKQEDTVLFLADGAYEVTFRGARPLSDDQVSRFRETTLLDFFYILRQRRNEPGMVFEAKGIDVVENQPVETLDIYDADNRNVTVWIHSDTWLPVRQRFKRWDPVINERREEVTHYTNYRDSGSRVMWPHEIARERDTEKIFQMHSDRVTIDDPLDDGLFQLPGGIKILTK